MPAKPLALAFLQDILLSSATGRELLSCIERVPNVATDVNGYMRVTADQWSAVSLPQANGQREAPESAPGHSQGIVPALRDILNISWLGWVTGLVLAIWGARKQSVKRHKMTTWVSWVYAHQIMRIRIRQKRFEILKVHIKLFRLRQQFSFVRRPERGRLGV